MVYDYKAGGHALIITTPRKSDRLLEKYFGGEHDALTISRLREDAPMPKPRPDVATRTSWEKCLPLPEARVALDFTASYSEDEFSRIRRGLIPRQMEDKWFIFYEEPWLYIHRSWTGASIYGVRFQSGASGVIAVESWASRDPSYKSTSTEYDLAILTFLIEAMLLGRPMRFPVPGDLPPSAPPGLFQHSVIGRGYPEKRFEVSETDDGASWPSPCIFTRRLSRLPRPSRTLRGSHLCTSLRTHKPLLLRTIYHSFNRSYFC